MAQGDVHRVVATETATERQQTLVAIFLADEGHNFVEKVSLVLHVASNAAAGSDLAVVPALAIHGIDAKELQLAGVNSAGESSDHAAVFKLEKAPAGGGENHDRHAGMAKDEQLHRAARAGLIDLVIFPVHVFSPRRLSPQTRTVLLLEIEESLLCQNKRVRAGAAEAG